MREAPAAKKEGAFGWYAMQGRGFTERRRQSPELEKPYPGQIEVLGRSQPRARRKG